jgi:hypothetical protein
VTDGATECDRGRGARQSLAVISSQVIALVGIFPFGLLYAFPILAALTLRDAWRWVRVGVFLTSSVLFVVFALADLQKP